MLKFRTKIEAISLVSLLVILSFSSAWAVTRNIQSNKETISGGTYFYSGSYDFINNSHFNLSNKITNSKGHVWNISASNLQLAIWDFNGSSYGGVVYLPADNVSLTQPIRISDNQRYVTIQGRGKGSGTNAKQGVSCLYKNFDGDYAINISFTSYTSTNSFALKDFDIFGANPDVYRGGGIYVKNAQWSAINNVVVKRVNGTGMYFDHVTKLRLQSILVVSNWNVGGEYVAGHGIYCSNVQDTQFYDVEVNYNNQSAQYAAVRINSSTIDIYGGHYEGWNAFNISGVNLVKLNGVFIPFSNERAIYCSAGSLKIADSYIVGSNYYNIYSGIQASCIYVTGGSLMVTDCRIGSSSYGHTSYSLFCTGATNTISNNFFGFSINFSGNGNIISNNNFNSKGIYGNASSYNKISNNYGLSELKVYYYNSINGNSATSITVGDQNLLQGNRLTSITMHTSNVVNGNYLTTYSITGTNNIIRNNIGNITEKWGNTSVANNGTISHGLASTPTVVLLTSNYANLTFMCMKKSATTFTVIIRDINTHTTPSGSYYVMWYAKV